VLRIITANVNGIRSAARKGFFDWLPQQQADVICLQEVRAQLDQMASERQTKSSASSNTTSSTARRGG